MSDFLQRPLHTESTWQQGADAARRGLPNSANPYITQDFNNQPAVLRMNAWANGWEFARLQQYKAGSDHA